MIIKTSSSFRYTRTQHSGTLVPDLAEALGGALAKPTLYHLIHVPMKNNGILC
jgi:hypothetical protein